MWKLSARIKLKLLIASLFLAICPQLRAVTILTGPTFTPSTNAPLAGVLQLSTDVNSRVSVLVEDGTNSWERDFYDFGTTHRETVLGFQPGQTNLMLVTVYDQYRNSCTAGPLLEFDTAPLPADFPAYTVLADNPAMMEPGYTLFLLCNLTKPQSAYATILDNSGNVVWYWKNPASITDNDILQLENGNLEIVQKYPYNNFLEINLLGQSVATNLPATNYPQVDVHEFVPTSHGTILYISDVLSSVTNFPVDYAELDSPLGTASVEDTPVVEISATNSAFLNAWSPVDLLDPTRITYLTQRNGLPIGGIDNEHGNAVLEDTNDNSLIISLRAQNAVYKVSREGQVKWILGPPANWSANFQPYLLTPVGTPFEWNYGQHAPVLTPQGTLMMFDDGDYRASPWDPPVSDSNNWSRAVEYSINETNMTVSQVWDSTPAAGDRLYAYAVGSARWLPQVRDVLVTYGLTEYVNGVHPSSHATNATMSRIIEYTHDPVPQVVFDVSFFDTHNTNATYGGDLIYRSDRISDLYAHPANPVTDMAVEEANGASYLEFSADPDRSYEIQASTDLVNWTTIGTPAPDGNPGDFGFDDLNASQFQDRFYRVVTQ